MSERMSRQAAWDMVEGRVSDVYDQLPEPVRRATYDDKEFARWFLDCYVAETLAPHLYAGRSIGHYILREKARLEAQHD